MLFNSIEFLFFFLFLFPLYLFLKHKWQNWVLIIASCVFYASWSWKFLFLMCGSITTDYFCAQYISRSNNETKRRNLLFLSIFVNLSILFFFKYFNFFSENILSLLKFFHLVSPFWDFSVNVILPLGISFYTFEAISYVVDVYRREVQPAKSYWDYFLFVIYFPHLVAGPIMRAKQFLPQIVTPRTCSWSLFYEGAHLFYWGLFEKIFIADNLAKIVNPMFLDAAPSNGMGIWVALYAFAFQIFCDFDGYSNMARGLGKCMGFEISINFNLPYFSISPREFWQRWHITLSSWFRDYLYIPLGGNRGGLWKTFRNLLIIMFLAGLWHGSAWHFVLWGLYQGVLLVIYSFIPEQSKETEEEPKNLWYLLKMFVFFHLTILGWLLFRSQSLGQIGAMLHAVFNGFYFSKENISLFFEFSAIISPLLIVQLFQFKNKDLMVLYRCHWFLKTVAYMLMAFLILNFGVMRAEQFIYFQF